MLRTASLVVLVLAAACCGANARQLTGGISLPDEVKACHNSTSQDECLGKTEAFGCFFCASSILPSGCYAPAEAQLLPESMFTCDNGTAPEPSAPAAVNGYPFAPPTPGYPGPPTPGAPGPAPGAGCSTHKAKKECKHDKKGKCVWCEAPYPGMPAQCMSESESKFMPGMKCTKVKPSAAHDNDLDRKHDDDDDDKPEPEPEPSCADLVKEKKCLKNDSCAWCTNKFVADDAGACYEGSQAKFMPSMVFDCKLPPSDDDDNASELLAAGSKKPDPEPTPAPGPAPSCMDLKEEKKCEKDSACSWCEPTFGITSPACYDADKAKYLPSIMYKCSEPSPSISIS